MAGGGPRGAPGLRGSRRRDRGLPHVDPRLRLRPRRRARGLQPLRRGGPRGALDLPLRPRLLDGGEHARERPGLEDPPRGRRGLLCPFVDLPRPPRPSARGRGGPPPRHAGGPEEPGTKARPGGGQPGRLDARPPRRRTRVHDDHGPPRGLPRGVVPHAPRERDALGPRPRTHRRRHRGLPRGHPPRRSGGAGRRDALGADGLRALHRRLALHRGRPAAGEQGAGDAAAHAGGRGDRPVGGVRHRPAQPAVRVARGTRPARHRLRRTPRHVPGDRRRGAAADRRRSGLGLAGERTLGSPGGALRPRPGRVRPLARPPPGRGRRRAPVQGRRSGVPSAPVGRGRGRRGGRGRRVHDHLR